MFILNQWPFWNARDVLIHTSWHTVLSGFAFELGQICHSIRCLWNIPIILVCLKFCHIAVTYYQCQANCHKICATCEKGSQLLWSCMPPSVRGACLKIRMLAMGQVNLCVDPKQPNPHLCSYLFCVWVRDWQRRLLHMRHLNVAILHVFCTLSLFLTLCRLHLLQLCLPSSTPWMVYSPYLFLLIVCYLNL
jgi:hypothetical protein